MNTTHETMLNVEDQTEYAQLPRSGGIYLPPDAFEKTLKRIEVFGDNPNITRAIEDLGGTNSSLGKLVRWTVLKFKKRLAKKISAGTNPSQKQNRPIVQKTDSRFYFGTAWWFMAQPKNYYSDDSRLVTRQQNRNEELRLREDLAVQLVPVDYHGFHIRLEDRFASKNEWERNWRKQDAGVDIALATKLLRRCLEEDHPHAVLLISGDNDFVPVLQEIIQTLPGIYVGVAAFRSRLSSVYWPRNRLGLHWHMPPIILDDFLNKSTGF